MSTLRPRSAQDPSQAPGSPARAAGGDPAPLSTEEHGELDRAARRLHSELVALLQAVPEEARNASGLARHLEVDRTTCQRAVYVASRPYPGLEVLERLPGARALRSLIEATRAADPPTSADTLDALEVAARQYRRLVSTLGGSLAQVQRRLALGTSTGAAPVGRGDDAAPEVRLFDAARDLTGRASDCWVAVYVYRPSPDDPRRVEVIRAYGLRGHQARRDAVPLVVHNFSSGSVSEASADDPRFGSLERARIEGRTPTIVLEDFTSDPPPLVTARQPGQFLVQSIDAPSSAASTPVDLMLATRSSFPHPAEYDPRIEEVWALVNFPARHLLLDVYLHPDLARRSVPSLDAHLWGPDFSTHVGDRWQTRFSETPPLQLLGTGVRASGPPAFPHLPELTTQLFARSELDPTGYVGFRCDVAYPLWRAGYCVTFDFSEPEG